MKTKSKSFLGYFNVVILTLSLTMLLPSAGRAAGLLIADGGLGGVQPAFAGLHGRGKWQGEECGGKGNC